MECSLKLYGIDDIYLLAIKENGDFMISSFSSNPFIVYVETNSSQIETNPIHPTKLSVQKSSKAKYIKNVNILEITHFFLRFLENNQTQTQENLLNQKNDKWDLEVRLSFKINSKYVPIIFETQHPSSYIFKQKDESIGINGRLVIEDKEITLLEGEVKNILNFLFGSSTSIGKLLFSDIVNGNRYEEIYSMHFENEDDDFWNDWKDDCERAVKMYRNEIYPICLNTLTHLLVEPKRILEICGGDGEFAERVFEKYGKSISDYTLVDRNVKSLEMARKKKSKNRALEKMHIEKIDLENQGFSEKLRNDWDMIIGIGALNYRVLESRQMAFKILSELSSILRPNGYIILAGLTPSLVNSDDLKKCGFEVKNTFPHYVAKKIGDPIK